MISYNNSEVVQCLRQYDMFANSLRLIRTTEEKNMVVKQLAKLENKILTLTNELYEEEYYALVDKECALLEEEKNRVSMLIDLINQRLSYVEKRCNNHYQLTGNSVDAPAVLGADALDELENRIRIIDKYSKNIKQKQELENDIKSLTSKISLASEKIEINESLNIELESALKKVMAEAFEKLHMYDLLDQKDDIEYIYRETEDSLGIARENLEVARRGRVDLLPECESMYNEVYADYLDYKDKISIIKLLQIFNNEVGNYEELLDKRKAINEILKYIKNREFINMVIDTVVKQYNTILMEQQDVNTFNDLALEKEKKEEMLEQIEKENNSNEFQNVLKVLIENERKKQEKILEEKRRKEEEERKERLEIERKRQEEILKRQKIIEEARKKEMEKRTKKMLEEQQNSVLQHKRQSKGVSFENIKEDISNVNEEEEKEIEIIKEEKTLEKPVEDIKYRLDLNSLRRSEEVEDDKADDVVILKNKQDIEKELFDEFNSDERKDKVVDDKVFTKIDETMNDSKLPDISIDEYMKNFDANKISDTNSLFDEEDFPSIPM